MMNYLDCLKKTVTSNKGQSIVEVVIGFGIATIVILVFSSGIVAIRNITTNTEIMSTNDQLINDIAENIKNGVENYQINFDYQASTDTVLDPNNLPMAWDAGVITTTAECAGCPGRFGYVIRPLEQFRGLYEVTLRMTHKSWVNKGEAFRDYNFVVSVK